MLVSPKPPMKTPTRILTSLLTLGIPACSPTGEPAPATGTESATEGATGGTADSMDGGSDAGRVDGTEGASAGESGSGSDDGPAATRGDSELVQYTPDQANWETFASKPFAGGTNTAHDPDGIGWMSPEDWAAAQWDGTIYNPSQMTAEEFVAAICPSVDRVRGIREVFYAHQPFADNANPTKAEVDQWHRIAINHVRALVGYTSDDRLVSPDHCMFARALWGDERKFTTMWDREYPGSEGSAEGPCHNSTNAHCGASFIPDLDDQLPYLPEGHEGCSVGQGAEGVFSGPKSNIPWSIKWSRGFCNTLVAEGFWGGHVGPWFHRETFGFSFWDDDPDDNDNNAILRAKWSGNLMPSLYCNPADPGCDPDSTGPMSGE